MAARFIPVSYRVSASQSNSLIPTRRLLDSIKVLQYKGMPWVGQACFVDFESAPWGLININLFPSPRDVE